MKKYLLAALAATTLAAANPADAALFQQVYTGTITSGYDDRGFFGVGQSLTGLAYTATYLIDDSKGEQYGYSNDDGAGSYYNSYGQIYGGADYGTTSPVSAKLTINGRTFSLNDGNQSSVEIYNYNTPYYSGNNDSVSSMSSVYSPDEYGNYSNDILTQFVEVDVATLTSSDFRTAQAFAPASGSGQFVAYDSRYGTQIFASFNVTSFASSTAAVPEPATWATMIVGFGMIGGAARYKRRKTTTTYA